MRGIEKKALLLALAVTAVVIGLLLYYFRIQSLYTGPMSKVVVASTSIKENTIIEEMQVKEEVIPQKLVTPGAVTDKKTVVGKITKDRIYPGEQVLGVNLYQGTGLEGMASRIPEGYRAVTIRTDLVGGVGGHIRTGDYVDILLYIKPPEDEEKEEFVTTLFQNVRVLDAGSENKVSDDARYLTLCMTPQESERLFLANEAGKIRLMLRQIADRKPSEIPRISRKDLQ